MLILISLFPSYSLPYLSFFYMNVRCVWYKHDCRYEARDGIGTGDRPVTGRMVVTGRPARYIDSIFASSLHHISLSGDKSGSRINFRPAGPVRSDRYRYRLSKIQTGSISVWSNLINIITEVRGRATHSVLHTGFRYKTFCSFWRIIP